MSTFKARALFCAAILACAFGAIVARLFVIQIVDNGYYAGQSKKQTQERMLITAHRGAIRDRKGVVLASTVDCRAPFAVTAADSLSGPNSRGAGGKTDVALAGKRLYPYGVCAGGVLGYVGSDGEGLGGAEFYFDNYLKGEDGWAILSRDGKNNKYAKINLPSKPPQAGSDVYLTIDLDIQTIVENALQQAVENLKAIGGMCIIMEPSTGKILAMAGEPSFNPNFAHRYSLSQRLNKCVNCTYEPGSTFKALTAACALQENVMKETDTLDGNHGVYEVFDQKIRDKESFGRLSFTEAFKYSSNVCFAKVANAIGNQRLYSYIKNFGFGSQTGIQVPGEEIGIVRPIDKWSGRSRVTMAIGQEISVTLLQMALLFAAAANGGVLVQPCLCEKIVGANGAAVDTARYKPIRRVISAETARRLRAIMGDVVNSGTGKKAAIKGVSVAGKTGTSQKIDKATGAYSEKRAWASFIGFLPADNPLLLGAVVIDEPANAEMGGSAAAPVFQKIMSQIISHPQLEYAEKILGRGSQPLACDSGKCRTAPELQGMPMDKAVGLLASERLPYELIGDKMGTVAYQIPQAGTGLGPDRKMRIYSRPAPSSETGGVVVPQCIGKDMRDAVNALNLKGLTPCARGCGIVHEQSLRPGAVVKPAQPCTLFCSFGEYAIGNPAGKAKVRSAAGEMVGF